MLSGVLTTESLTQAFRTLSQRRRHGMLEVVSTAGHFNIIFHNGRIVSAYNVDEPLVSSVCKKLVDAHLLDADVVDAAVEACPTIDALYSALVDGGVVKKEDFSRAQNVVQMDILYSLRHAKSGYFDFKSSVTDAGDKLALSVPPGQLLLDLLELETDEGRFEKQFGTEDQETVFISPVTDDIDDLSKEERVLWKTLEVSNKLSEIRTLALLNEYQLREGLLGLLEKNYIEVGDEEMLPPPTSVRHSGTRVGYSAGGVLNHLLDDLETEVASGLGELSTVSSTLHSPAPEEAESDDEIDSLIERAASLLIDDEEDDFAETNGHSHQGGEQTQVEVASTLGAAAPINSAVEVSNGMIEGAAAMNVKSDEVSQFPRVEISPWMTVKQWLIQGNFRLLEERALNFVTILLTFIFLVALGIVVPKMIDKWFGALSLLTSPSSNIVIELNNE